MQGQQTLEQLNRTKMNRRSLLRRAGAIGLALPVGGMLLNACSSSGNDDENPTNTIDLASATGTTMPAETADLTVSAFDLGFDPDSLTVEAGQKVRLTFVNDGAMEHDWEVTGLTASDFTVISQPEPFSERLTELLAEKQAANIPYAGGAAGQEMVIEFTPDESGEYEMVCLVPGHKEAGMAGPFIVTGESASSEMEHSTSEAGSGMAAAASEPYEAERLPNPVVAPPVGNREPELVTVDIEVRETIAAVDEGVAFEFWTFGGTVPGPMVRARVGDTIEVTLTNPPDSVATHNIDFHAATGPGGGGHASVVAPGESATFRFKATAPGAYVYHCATAPVPHHISAGMYGLAIIEPEGGLPPVDKEFYVMQGDLYLEGTFGDKGLRPFSMEKMLDERPDYVIFNGSVGSLMDDRALQAEVGDTVRIFFGVGGPNITSSFHVIGEIFDRVAMESASEWSTNVQTTMVPAGGATIVEFECDYPGTFVLVDHSLGRLLKGAAGHLVVEGEVDPDIFEVVDTPTS